MPLIQAHAELFVAQRDGLDNDLPRLRALPAPQVISGAVFTALGRGSPASNLFNRSSRQARQRPQNRRDWTLEPPKYARNRVAKSYIWALAGIAACSSLPVVPCATAEIGIPDHGRHSRQMASPQSAAAEPPRVSLRVFWSSHAASTVCSRWQWHAASTGGRWPVPAHFEEPAVVEPVDPLESRELHRLEVSPRSSWANQLRLVQVDDRSAKALSYESPTLSTDYSDAGLGQAFGLADGEALRPALAMVGLELTIRRHPRNRPRLG